MMSEYSIGGSNLEGPIDLRRNYYIDKAYHWTKTVWVPEILVKGLLVSKGGPSTGKSWYTGKLHPVPPALYFHPRLEDALGVAEGATAEDEESYTVLALNLKGIPVRADPELTERGDESIYAGYVRQSVPPSRIRVVKTFDVSTVLEAQRKALEEYHRKVGR